MLRKMRSATPVLVLLLTVGCAGLNTRQIEQILDQPLDNETVAAGLKDALRIGTRRAADKTSRVDGFYGNQLIRIALPDQYTDAADALRRLGLGSQVDSFELSMNRAAEQASAEAVDVFLSAVTRLTIADALDILHGENNAATLYFWEQTNDELRSRFQPIVRERMEAVGVYRLYEDLSSYYSLLPVSKPEAVALDAYITTETLAGLFLMLEKEEFKIRKDPGARTTELLRRVFG